MRLLASGFFASLLLTPCLADSLLQDYSVADEQTSWQLPPLPLKSSSRIHNDKKALRRVRKRLRKTEIIPTVLDDFHPTALLNVTWPSGARAKLGRTYYPSELQDAPSVHLFSMSCDSSTSPICSSSSAHSSLSALSALAAVPPSNVVLTMTDPDAPSRSNPKWGEFCHWIATGVSTQQQQHPGAEAAVALDELVPYYPPGPPARTGRHRYVFLVLVPANGTSEPLQLRAPGERQHWGTGVVGGGVKGWMEEMGLEAVAANFLYSKDEDQGEEKGGVGFETVEEDDAGEEDDDEEEDDEAVVMGRLGEL